MAYLRSLNLVIITLLIASISSSVQAAKWQISPPSNVLIDTSLFAAQELSGITYKGPGATALHHTFLAVQDDGGKLLTIDVELSPTGTLVSASTTASLALAASLDFEGAAYTNPTRNSVFLAEENSPGVREYDLSTGATLQTVSIPSVFSNRRNNFGFESLARTPDGTTMWTANEEALTSDGPLSTVTTGTTVRLMKMNVAGDSVTAAEQFVYQTAPIHVSGIDNRRRSGVSDLVTLPDGTLLALERSFGLALPLVYKNSIYEVGLAGATDVSASEFNTGLIGKTYTPASKELLWSGAAAGSTGQNLEGLTLGPRLANGNWLLVGVVDNSSGEDVISQNTLITFELSAIPFADFDEDGDVDGRDFLAWQRGYGKTIGAKFSQGDADRDGDVDAADLAIWSEAYGAPAIVAAAAIPEPNTLLLLAFGAVLIVGRRHTSRHII